MWRNSMHLTVVRLVAGSDSHKNLANLAIYKNRKTPRLCYITNFPNNVSNLVTVTNRDYLEVEIKNINYETSQAEPKLKCSTHS